MHWSELLPPSPPLSILFSAIQLEMMGRNKKALETVTRQIEITAAAQNLCEDARYPQPLTKSSVSLQDHILKTNAALAFECDPQMAAKIKDLKTETGHLLIEEMPMENGKRRLGVWNETKRSRDAFEEIYAERSAGTANQFSAYYDRTNKSLTINFGGTDFSNGKDRDSVRQTTVGAVDMRMTDVKRLVDKTMAEFERLHPGVLPHIPVDIYSHSAGANSVPLANYFLQRGHHIAPRAQVMLDPFGAKNSFENVAAIAAHAEKRDKKEILGELTHNTQTYKVENGTFVDHLGFMDQYNWVGPGRGADTVGRVDKLPIKGNAFTAHGAKSWIEYFNHAEASHVKPAESCGPLMSRHLGTQVAAPAQKPEDLVCKPAAAPAAKPGARPLVS